jgi:hypothetical protein
MKPITSTGLTPSSEARSRVNPVFVFHFVGDMIANRLFNDETNVILLNPQSIRFDVFIASIHLGEPSTCATADKCAVGARKLGRRMAAAALAHEVLSIHLRAQSAAPPLLPLRVFASPSLLSGLPNCVGTFFTPMRRNGQQPRQLPPQLQYAPIKMANFRESPAPSRVCGACGGRPQSSC